MALAIASEIFGTAMLKVSDGFTEPLPSVGVLIGFGVSFFSLSLSLKSLPLSLAYAIWSGVGTVVTAIIGTLLWKDPFSVVTLAGILLIIGGVVLLNSGSPSEEGTKAAG